MGKSLKVKALVSMACLCAILISSFTPVVAASHYSKYDVNDRVDRLHLTGHPFT